jgi:hypothetical protein
MAEGQACNGMTRGYLYHLGYVRRPWGGFPDHNLKGVTNEYRYVFRTIEALARGECRLSQRQRHQSGRIYTLDRYIASRRSRSRCQQSA